LFAVEIQGFRDAGPREVLVTVDTLLAPEAGKSLSKSRKRSKRRKNSESAVTGDLEGRIEMLQSGIRSKVETAIKHLPLLRDNQNQATSASANRAQDMPLFFEVGGERDVNPLDETEDRELFAVKRYPAYHYDMYGTMYSLTDGVRPSTLERDTIKSASADCLDVLGVSAQPVERRASNDEVSTSAADSPVAERRKPKLPPKPLPRSKPTAKHGATPSTDLVVQPALNPATTDSELMNELSSLLKQRNQ